MVNPALYERLQQAARKRSLVSYDEIAALLGLNLDNNAHRVKLGRLLIDISRHEHKWGNPLLSVIVVNENSQMPNKGFFYAARELGKYESRSASETLAFFNNEVKANVLFFDKRSGSPNAPTKNLWIYALHTNMKFTLKQNPLR